MNISLITIALLVAMMTVVHFAAIWAGLYEGDVWVDMPLHVFGGSALGLFWLWFAQHHRVSPLFGTPSSLLLSITAASAALIGSFSWEVAEFLFWHTLPDYASTLKFYSPTVTDALSDMAFGVLGGVFVALWYYCRTRT